MLKLDGKVLPSNQISYFVEPYTAKPEYYHGIYHRKGHAYILQHAIRLLRADGFTNWADVAHANLLHLQSGATHADYYKGRIVAAVQVEVLWGLVEVDICTFDLACLGGCDHFYNCDNGTGLEAPDEAVMSGPVLECLLDWIIAAFGLDLGGVVTFDLEICPALQMRYPSAVALCDEHFDRAVRTWEDGSTIYEGRSAIESAFYELGWACHFLQDLTVPHHVHNSYMPGSGHQEMEDFADMRGDPDEPGIFWRSAERPYRAYHPPSGKDKDLDAYHHDLTDPSKGWPAGRFARTVAERTYNHPNLWEWAQPMVWQDADKLRGQVLEVVLPLAEAYTAGLIARFMSETGVPPTAPPLQGRVRVWGGDVVPGACVFYAPVGSTIQIDLGGPAPDPFKNWKGWSMVQADSQGRYSLPVQPQTKYFLRPAMPGYSFEGRTSRNLEFGKPESPVLYYQAPGMFSGNTLDLFLTQLPLELAKTPQAQLLQRPLTIPGRAAGAQSAVRPTAHLIRADTRLERSRTTVSPALADRIQRALIEVKTDQNVLGVQNSGTGLPESATVTVQLSRLMDMTQGKMLTTTSEILSSIDATRAVRQQARPGPANIGAVPHAALTGAAGTKNLVSAIGPGSQAGLITKDAWLAMKPHLSAQPITSGAGRQGRVLSLGRDLDSVVSADSLWSCGLVPVPSLGGAEIEVRTIPGAGCLMAERSPLRLTTGRDGAASLVLKTGSHAGRIRLAFKVVKNPDGVDIQPTEMVELTVQPPLKGPDPVPARPPTMQAVPQPQIFMMQVVVPGPSAQPSARYRVSGQVGADGVFRTSSVVRLDPSAGPPPIAKATSASVPMAQAQLSPAGPAPAALSESFDGQALQGWQLGPGWQVAQYGPGQQGLHGTQHTWARYTAGTWSDFTLSLKLNLVRGGIHLNCRTNGPQRYFVGLRDDEIYLAKQTGPQQFSDLAASTNTPGLSLNQWHSIAVVGKGGQISVTVDGVTAIAYTDPQPLAQGGIAFETLDDSEAWIDDVVVSGDATLPPTQAAGPQQPEASPLQNVIGAATQALGSQPASASAPIAALQQAMKPSGRAALLQSLLGSKAGSALLEKLPKVAGFDLAALATTVLGGPPVLQEMPTAAPEGGSPVAGAKSLAEYDWQVGIRFYPVRPSPVHTLGASTYPIGMMALQGASLPPTTGAADPAAQDLVHLSCAPASPAVAALYLELPPGAANYAVGVHLSDPTGASPQSWVQGAGAGAGQGAPIVSAYVMSGGPDTGQSPVPLALAPMSNQPGYVGACTITPAPSEGQWGMHQISCVISLQIEAPGSGHTFVFGGFTIARL